MKLKKVALMVFLCFVFAFSAAFAAGNKLKEGTYNVGKDIDEGDYIITCVELDDSSKDMAVDILTALSGGSKEASAFWNLMGSQTKSDPAKIKVSNQDGKTVDEFELDEGESNDISLLEGYKLKISNGVCSLTEKDKQVEIIESIEMEWFQSKDDIKAAMDKKVGKEYKYNDIESIEYEGESVSKYDASLAYIFKDDALYGKAYYLEDVNGSKYKYLIEALTTKYGKPTYSEDDCIKLFDFLTGIEIDLGSFRVMTLSNTLLFATWIKEGNTNIIIFQNTDENQTVLFYGLKWNLMSDDGVNLNNL